MNFSFVSGYIFGFFSPVVLVVLISLRCDYLYHRKNGHTKTKSLRLTLRRAFW